MASHPDIVNRVIESGDHVTKTAILKQIAAETYVPPKKNNEEHEAKARHVEFQEKKKENIVSMDDAKQDRKDRRTIAWELYTDLMSIIKKSTWMMALNSPIDLGDLKTVIAEKDKATFKQDIERLIMFLNRILREI